MAVVRFLSSDRIGEQVSLTEGPIILGRQPECDVALADEAISRRHARMYRADDGYYIEDLGSRNGTQVNGQRIEYPTRLVSGDLIQIRNTSLEFQDESERRTPAAETAVVSSAAEFPRSRTGGYYSTISEIEFSDPGLLPSVTTDVKLQAVLDITRALRSSLEPEEVLSRIVDCVTQMFPHYSRSYLLRQDEGNGRLVPVAVKQQGEETEGPVTLRPVAQALARQVLEQGKAILSVGVSGEGDAEASVLDDGSLSFMCAPLIGPSQEPAGILYIETHDEERRFTHPDLELFTCASILAGQALEQANSFGARYRSVVDTAADGLITVNEQGIIESVNLAVGKLFGYRQAELVGRNVRLLMTDPDRERFDTFLSNYTRTGQSTLGGAAQEAVARRRDGTTFPIYLSIGNFSLAGKRYFTGIIHDISERQRADFALKKLNETLELQVRERTASIRLLQDVAVIANEANSVEEAFRAALARVCRFPNWEAGHVFLRSSTVPEELVDTEIWSGQRLTRYRRLMAATKDTVLRANEGPLGEVISTRQSVWLADLAADATFNRGAEAASAGLATLAACPVLVGNEVVAVIELFSENPVPPDQIFLDVMKQVGTALGRVIERNHLQRQLIDAVWEQHRRLGQELHDTLGQALTGILMLADSITKRLKARDVPEADKLGEMVTMIQQAKMDVRQMSKGLYPVDVDAQGLLAALDDLALATEQRTRIRCVFLGDPAVHISDNEVATHLYRIAQEAILNAVKHGKPTRIMVGLKKPRGLVTLTIRDDGIGLPLARAEHAGSSNSQSAVGGLGMHIMRYRAQAMGADLTIKAAEDGGTEVCCTLRREP